MDPALCPCAIEVVSGWHVGYLANPGGPCDQGARKRVKVVVRFREVIDVGARRSRCANQKVSHLLARLAPTCLLHGAGCLLVGGGEAPRVKRSGGVCLDDATSEPGPIDIDAAIPQPGLQVDIDGQMGIVKTVSGGRTIVDFNHPLSGKELVYEVEIKRIVNDDKEKLTSLVKLQLGILNPVINVAEGKATIKVPAEIPKEIAEPITESMEEMTGIKEIKFAKLDEKKPEGKPAVKADPIETKPAQNKPTEEKS